MKALKAELGAMAAELREATTELAELKNTRKDLRYACTTLRLLQEAVAGLWMTLALEIWLIYQALLGS